MALLRLRYLFVSACVFFAASAPALSQTMPNSAGVPELPDSMLLPKRWPAWWHATTPSPNPSRLGTRVPSPREERVIAQAKTLLATRAAKAIALVDGENVVFIEYKAPADENSLFLAASVGKTFTAMAAGKAVCAGKMALSTTAGEVIPELQGKPLGNASLHDLLRMASGAAEPASDSTIVTAEEWRSINAGKLRLVDVMASDRVAQAARGFRSTYKPGEHFSYKSTDALTVGLMIARAAGPFGKWVQENVIDSMGAGHAGVYEFERGGDPVAGAGMRLRLEDWVRFAVWVKRESLQPGCFGDFVRDAVRRQIRNSRSRADRKFGASFGAYGYFVWLENEVAPDTFWAVGHGGQRIGWHSKSDRIVIAFSNLENWMGELYALARDWNAAR